MRVSRDACIIVDEAIGNHYVVAPGDISEELRYVARILNARLEGI